MDPKEFHENYIEQMLHTARANGLEVNGVHPDTYAAARDECNAFLALTKPVEDDILRTPYTHYAEDSLAHDFAAGRLGLRTFIPTEVGEAFSRRLNDVLNRFPQLDLRVRDGLLDQVFTPRLPPGTQEAVFRAVMALTEGLRQMFPNPYDDPDDDVTIDLAEVYEALGLELTACKACGAATPSGLIDHEGRCPLCVERAGTPCTNKTCELPPCVASKHEA